MGTPVIVLPTVIVVVLLLLRLSLLLLMVMMIAKASTGFSACLLSSLFTMLEEEVASCRR